MKAILSTVAVAALLLGTSANAEPQKTPAQVKAELARFSSAAGTPVERYTNVATRTVKFEPIGTEHVLVYTRPTTAYLLTLDGRCEGLENAQAITAGNGSRVVYAKTDYVFVKGPENPAGMRCKIETIQPVDLKLTKKA